MTISLGDACRPGCLADASDVCQIEELVQGITEEKARNGNKFTKRKEILTKLHQR